MMTLEQTRIAVQIVITDDAGELAYLLLIVTNLFALLASAARFVSYVTGWVSDIKEAVVFTVKLFSIAFNSLAWGLGVTI